MLIKSNETASPDQCVPWQDAGDRSDIGASFFYIFCNEFPTSEYAVRPGGANMFPPLAPSTGQLCQDPRFTGTEVSNSNIWWEQKLGLEYDRIVSARRLLIINGQYDPTGALNPKLNTRTDRMAARVLNVGDLSHTEDIFSYAVMPKGLNRAADLVSEGPRDSACQPCVFYKTNMDNRLA